MVTASTCDTVQQKGSRVFNSTSMQSRICAIVFLHCSCVTATFCFSDKEILSVFVHYGLKQKGWRCLAVVDCSHYCKTCHSTGYEPKAVTGLGIFFALPILGLAVIQIAQFIIVDQDPLHTSFYWSGFQ